MEKPAAIETHLTSQDAELVGIVPKELARQSSIAPLAADASTLHIVISSLSPGTIREDLAFLTGRSIVVDASDDGRVEARMLQLYGDSSRPRPLQESQVEQGSSIVTQDDQDFANGSAVEAANKIISDAIAMGASDIHVEPYERTLRVRYRLDGVLHEQFRPPLSLAKALISRLKIMADLDIAEKRRPQDGRIRVKEEGRIIDIRVSSLPTDFGEKIVLRILDKSQLRLDLGSLGFQANELNLFQKTIRLPYGMILVTGPTGSGKTTTLYAALNSINRPELNITTIEDPIEYNLAGINQTQVRSDIGLTFAAVLRSILRQDPNVIMVGEIRDSETAQIAIRSALTGHLVFSTLHTNDAPSALTRLVDMGVEPFLVASSVKMILAQRLLRKTCPSCAEPHPLKAEDREALGLAPSDKGSFERGRGCRSCNQTGYKGRTAVYEILPVGNGVSDLIARGALASEIRRKGQEHGMKTLRDAAIEAARRGVTTIEEVLRET